MQEIFYNNSHFNNLIQTIIKTGDMNALFELNSIIVTLNKNNQKLNAIDSLSLYYLYCIWMPEGLKKDFHNFNLYLIKDINNIFIPFIQNENYNCLEYNNTISDQYSNILIDIANDIIYKYTNGIYGTKREKKPIYNYLTNLCRQNYSYINDTVLKLLFFGNIIYKEQLFYSKAEYDIFYAFLMEKDHIIFTKVNKEKENIENNLAKIKLI